jgi:RHS repeat-associated protein
VAIGGDRYGFNGKENDGEVKGEGNSLDFGARVYDPRISGFLSVDPLTGSYPDISPYLYAEDNPIYLLDVEGMAAGDFNTVDPPTKTQPGIGTSRPQRTPDPHRVAEGGRILRNVFRGPKYLGTSNPVSLAIRGIFEPASIGTGDVPKFNPPSNYPQEDQILRDVMHLTNDPANDLSDAEKKSLQERINSGMATQNDKLQYSMLGQSISLNSFFSHTSFEKLVDKSGDQFLGAEFGFTSPKSGVMRVGEFLSEYHAKGETLELLSAAFYIRGMSNEEGAGELTARGTNHLLNTLKDKARAEGFKFLRIQFKRTEQSSSAKPGHEVDKTYKL